MGYEWRVRYRLESKAKQSCLQVSWKSIFFFYLLMYMYVWCPFSCWTPLNIFLSLFFVFFSLFFSSFLCSGANRRTVGCDASRITGGDDNSAYLGKITKWRQDNMPSESVNGAKYGLWHALTNCFPPPGTVGQAYVGTTCSGSHNTGYSSWSGGLWATYAHEVGHNWGASHTMNTGGTWNYWFYYSFIHNKWLLLFIRC